MKTNILTSGFPQGFTSKFNDTLIKSITTKNKLVFVASDFNNNHEKTDKYCAQWERYFHDCGIAFKHSFIITSRVSPKKAQDIVSSADVLWLSGGNTLAQIKSIEAYGLIPILQERDGVTIGMSAGSINMATTAICIPDREEAVFAIYPGIGLVGISIEPHYGSRSLPEEMLRISKEYPIYALTDESFIVLREEEIVYSGNIVLFENGEIKQISQAF